MSNNNTNRDRIKNRIAKLLGLAADDAAAEGEVENALKFAEQLMAEHNIDRAECIARGEKRDESFGEGRAWTGGYVTCAWERNLAWLICRAMGTVQWYKGGGAVPKTDNGLMVFEDGKPITKKRQKIQFYGPGADVAVAVDMFNTVRATVAGMAVARYGTCYRAEGRDYSIGFIQGMDSTIKKQEMNRPTATTDLVRKSTDIVKADAKDWLQTAHGWKLRTTSAKSSRTAGVRSKEALTSGRADGRAHGIQTGGVRRMGTQKRLG